MSWNFGLFDPKTFRAPVRQVTRVFLHCTDSDNEALKGIGLAEEVNRWHLANGWAGIGYHFIVDKEGQVMTGRPLELTPAAQLGEVPLVAPAMVHMGNVATIAISTHGSKIFTPEGLAATHALMAAIDAAYAAAGARVTFHGHCEIDPRPCPVYPYRIVHGLDADGRLGAYAGLVSPLATSTHPPESWTKLPIVDPPHPPIDERSLFEGCHGDDVAELQRKLTAAGFDTQGVDGWFGRNTYNATMNWQRAHGVTPATGIIALGAGPQ